MKLKNSFKIAINILIFIFLLVNIFFLARNLEYIYFPGELSALEKAQQASQSVIKYSEELADSYGVVNRKDVQEILARFKYEVEKADSSEEVASLMIDYGRQVQDVIFREMQNKRMNRILNVVNTQDLPEKGNITITSIDSNLKFIDPENILSEDSRKKLEEITFNQTIELKIKNKKATILTADDLFNQVDFLKTKVASLERQLKDLKEKAGYETLNREGVIIEVYDNNEGLESASIVHDSDIRDIVNELLIAGAEGIEVGGQRLTAVSSIRCVGPTVLVNNNPIPVNPVTIKAAGESDVLTSSLDIIKKQLKAFGIELIIKEKGNITLNKVE